MNKLILLELLKSITSEIKNDNCNVSNVTANKLVSALTEMNKNIYLITKESACKDILHCSEETFEKLCCKQIIPIGKYNKDLQKGTWCINDFNDAIDYLNR